MPDAGDNPVRGIGLLRNLVRLDESRGLVLRMPRLARWGGLGEYAIIQTRGFYHVQPDQPEEGASGAELKSSDKGRPTQEQVLERFLE